MAHEVFIGYSTPDKKIADAICKLLEDKGIPCWIAPRDVPIGRFGGVIVEAVTQSKVMVFVFSTHSNRSANCLTEVHTAFNKGIKINTLRLDDTAPSDDMEYYLQLFHWLDAREPPIEQHLEALANRVEKELAEIAAKAEATTREQARREAEEAARLEKERQEEEAARSKEEAEAAKAAKKRREAEQARAKEEAESAKVERKRQQAEKARAKEKAVVSGPHKIGRRSRAKSIWLWLGITVAVLAVIGVSLRFTVFTTGQGTTWTPPITTTAATTTPPTSYSTPTPAPTPMPTTTTRDKIIVGMVRSLTGPNAAVSDAGFRPVYETWVAEVNAAGGIYVAEYGKKLPIELKIYDDESNIDKVPQLTEKLIDDKVDFLWPACGDDMFLAQASIANDHNYILIAAEGSTTKIRQTLPDMPYVFSTLSSSDWNQLPVLADLLAAKGCQSAFIIYVDDAFGAEYNSVAGTEFGRVGIQILGTRAITMDTEDLTEVISEAKASGADAFMCFAYPNHIMNAVDVSMQLDYNPKAWLGGPGVNFGFFHSAFGSKIEGVMGWTTYSRKSSPALKALADKLYIYHGNSEDLIDWWGASLYWAGLDMWKAAIEQAGTLDQTTIRDILATEHFQTILGETWFDNGLLAKECHPGEVGQWINGIYEVVGPPDRATETFIYPKPEWPN